MSESLDQRPLVITGAGGFVGSHLRRLAAGWPGGVVLVSRRALDVGAREALVRGDLSAPEPLAAHLPRGALVINLAYDAHGGRAPNLALAEGLARLCLLAEVTRLVHVSTAMVVGLVRERLVTETTECRPVTPYQHIKLDVERRLREQLSGRCPLVILRPTAVFGRDGMNLRKLVRDLRQGPPAINYLRSALFGRRPLNLVPVETVAAAARFVALSDRVVTEGLFLVADDDAAANTFRDVESVLRQALGYGAWAVPPAPVPAGLLVSILRVAGRLSFDPRTRFSSARLEQAGFTRPVTFPEALAAYAADARDLTASGAAP